MGIIIWWWWYIYWRMGWSKFNIVHKTLMKGTYLVPQFKKQNAGRSLQIYMSNTRCKEVGL